MQGTKGIWQKDNRSIYLERLSPESHVWEPEGPYLEEYDHPLWKKFESKAKGVPGYPQGKGQWENCVWTYLLFLPAKIEFV